MNCIKDGKLTHDSCFGCHVDAEHCEIKPLFEKQTPKKPIDDSVEDETMSGAIYIKKILVCPNCDNIYLPKKQPFCDKCGQALKWEG